MKKLISIASAVILVASFAAAADKTTADKSAREKSESSKKKDDKSKSDKDGGSESSAAGHSASGTVTSWNDAAKEFTVADSKGKQWSFAWNTATKLDKAPKVGDHVKVKYTADKAGKVWATQIHSGAKKATPESTTAKK